jgi:hypothetical protein
MGIVSGEFRREGLRVHYNVRYDAEPADTVYEYEIVEREVHP